MMSVDKMQQWHNFAVWIAILLLTGILICDYLYISKLDKTISDLKEKRTITVHISTDRMDISGITLSFDQKMNRLWIQFPEGVNISVDPNDRNKYKQ